MNLKKYDLLFKSSYSKRREAGKLRISVCVFIIFSLSLKLSQVNAQVSSNGVSPQVQQGAPGIPGPMTGSSIAIGGTMSNYTVTAGTNATSYAWSVTSGAGTISGTSLTATVTWSTTFIGTATISCYSVNSSGRSPGASTKAVSVTQPLTPGVIGPSVSSIGYNFTPTIVAGAPSGGNNSYAYQWQYATAAAPTTFINISGFTSQGFPGAGYNITSTTYFRRMDSSYGNSSPTNAAEFIVYPLSIGNIMPETQDISAGATVFPLSVSQVSGNTSSYTYLWQTSSDNINWTPITGATSLSYSPSPVSVTTWYRLQVTCNGSNFYSRSARVLIGNCPQLTTNPGTSMNYIATSTFRNAGITSVTDAQIAGMTICDVNQTIEYADGLGRPIQTVQTKASPTQLDIVQPMAYDQFDREVIKYLPYEVATTAADDGSYKTTALTDEASFYSNPANSTWNAPGVVQTSYPNATTNIEPSPLNRPIEQGFPGQSWQVSTSGVTGSGHTVTTVYATNNATSLTSTTGYWAQQYEVTFNLTYNGNYNGTNSLSQPGAYPYGTLYLTITRNENWSASQSNLNLNTTQEYKDIFGNVVLKRTFNFNTATGLTETLSTYYVYDGYHNLTYVIPPAANPDAGGITQNVLDHLCYQYRYDGRNRLQEKKIPGKGWEIMIYNNLDQVIGRQDSVQRMANPQQVSYTKYDSQGRAIQTGIYTISGAPGTDESQTLQAAAIAQTINWETKSATGVYSNVTIPTTGATILTTNYYDDYINSGAPLATYVAPAGATNMTRGLLTSSQIAVLNTPADGLWDILYYDDLGRPIKSYAQHYVGGHTSYSISNYDLSTTYYNFTNQVDTTIRQHYRSSSTSPKVTIANFYSYDQVGRRLTNTEQIAGSNGVAQTSNILSLARYNAFGQSYIKNISSGLQTYTYAYNERGWLISMTPSVGGNFAETLAYDSPTGTVTPQYSGNISQFNYNSPYMAAHYSQATSYINTVNYTYDNLNRLTKSQSGLTESDEAVSYDLNGNIKTLVRTGPSLASLAYTYNNSGISNEVAAVTNNSSAYRTYSYDGNGNSLSDGGTKAINYNMLNLPQSITSGGSTLATYFYDANGSKLRNVSSTAGTFDYDAGIVYLNGKISFIQTEEGKANLHSDSVTYTYSYDLKDYLGNIRASFDNGGTGNSYRIIQENDYYPFGLSQLYYDNFNGNRYLYNGKEQQYDLTSQYDYGARFYDPVIARWTTVDPDAEHSRRFTPYNYGADNSINNIDPDGMDESVGELQNIYGSNSVQILASEPEVTTTMNYNPAPVAAAAMRSLMGATPNTTNDMLVGGEPAWGTTVTLVYYLTESQTTLMNGTTTLTTKTYTGKVYGQEGWFGSRNTTIAVKDKIELEGFDIGSKWGWGSGTSYSDVQEIGTSFTTEKGGITWAHNPYTNHMTVGSFVKGDKNTITGHTTDIDNSKGENNLKQNFYNFSHGGIFKFLIPPPVVNDLINDLSPVIAN